MISRLLLFHVVAKLDVRSATVAQILLVWLVVTPGTIGAQPPQKEYAQVYQEPFKGQAQKAGDFRFLGADANTCVKFEPDGLRITMPAGKIRGETGVATAFGVSGDFEIAVRYEILEEPEPADSGSDNLGTRISLTATLDRPGISEASIRRKIIPQKPVHFLTYRTMQKDADSKPESKAASFPVTQKTGRFRLMRTGSDITYYLAEGMDEEFTLLTTHPFGPEDLKDVRIFGQTSGLKAALDARFSDLQIRAASLPRKPVPPKTDPVSAPKIPTKDYAARYFQSFKGSGAMPAGWEFTGQTIQQWVHFEQAGLRLTLPPGWADERPATGVRSLFGVRGDFEITVQFEILKDPVPTEVGKFGMRLSLAVDLDTLDGKQKLEVATINRTQSLKREGNFLTWMRNRERPNGAANFFPTTATTGRLRLVRSGDELYYLVSAGGDPAFKFLKMYRFGAADLKRVGINATTGDEKAEVDLRITDLLIRADAIPDAPASSPASGGEAPPAAVPPGEGGRAWLFAVAIPAVTLVFVGILAVGGWFFLRTRSTASTVPIKTAGAMLSFACAKCSKTLKAKPALAGKRVKCTRCGGAVPVPSNEADAVE